MKQCGRCGERKPFEEFHRRGKESYQAYCKDCSRKESSEWYHKNKDKGLEVRRAYRLSKFGLTIDSYNALLASQNYCCKTCKMHYLNFDRWLAVDHCHNTGKVRGLLCENCNRALGLAQDSPDILYNLIKYLELSE